MNPNEMMNYLDHLLKMPEEKSVPLIDDLIERHNSMFFNVLDKMNTLQLLRIAADDSNYYLAAKLHILGCNNLKDRKGNHPFDCLSMEQQENVSRYIRMLSDEIDESRCKKFTSDSLVK